jgi:CheY-like chemotaxis protein
MQERVILIAEDDPQAILSWEQDIREFNRSANQQIQYIAEYAKSKRSAIRFLDRTRVNCVAIDLRLPEDDGNPGSNATEPIGNEVLEQILLEVGVPAVVYSGYPQEASDQVRSSRIRVIGKKGGGAMEALCWLAEHESLMSAMEITRKRVAQQSAIIFNQSIWPRWADAWKFMESREVLASVITRQIVSHAAEQLCLPPNLCHPEEFYVVPPLATDRLGTGDLVKVNDRICIVVTPRCNMARDSYPSQLMLAVCKPMEGIWTGMRNRFNNEDVNKKKDAAEELHLYASQGHAIATHFLPPCGENGPWLVNFKEIVTISSTQVTELLATRFASISPQFLPNLIQRYSAYLGRIGQPDLDCEALRTGMCKI